MKEEFEYPAYDSINKKLSVQWLYQAICLAFLNSMVADSYCLRNRQLLLAPNRYALPKKTRPVRI